jgi:phosphatidate cytidylyltransferase
MTSLNRHYWLFIGALWVLSGTYFIHRGPSKWLVIHKWVRNIFGLIVLCAAWLALIQAKLMGTGYLLSILLIVWVADIGAYFAGRRWGKVKLAPHISPGKSVEGALGGIACVFLLATCWLLLDVKIPMMQVGIFEGLFKQGWLVFILGTLFLTLMSVIGDLFESLIKRSAGVKDSSQLLPGHGGVLDRLDALLPVLPLAIMLTQI